MARTRYIKPDFFTDEDMIELDIETRLLFIGLWTIADREGRLENKPKQIKIKLFPADEVDVAAKLRGLHEKGRILLYVVEGKEFIQIKNFAKHQRPHSKEAASTIPAPDEPRNYAASTPKMGNENQDGEQEGPPPSGIESVADELAIQQTETAFKVRLDPETKSKIAKAVPPKLVHLWPAYIQGRSVGQTKLSDREKLAKIGYCLTDFQRDHKRELDELARAPAAKPAVRSQEEKLRDYQNQRPTR